MPETNTMNTNKLTIPYAEFYITHVCNLACDGCNRFNNYKFTGFQKWDDCAEIYQQWATQVDIGSIGILGGEPLLNKDIIDWISGVRKLWKRPLIRVVTNGFYLNKVKGLYDLLVKDKSTQLWIGIHNKAHKKKIMKEVHTFFAEPFSYNFDNTNPYMQYMEVTDANGVVFRVEYNWWFHQGAIINQGSALTLHDSDPVKAHEICHMKTCHHFIQGQLYKCGVVGVLPDFDEQHNLSLSNEDKNLLHGYKPLNIHDDHATKKQFIESLNQVIPQCKFCPEQYFGEQIFSQEKRLIHKQ